MRRHVSASRENVMARYAASLEGRDEPQVVAGNGLVT